jgi:predicted amidohydrolase YtcJ
VIPSLIDSHVHFIRCGIKPGHEVRIIETATSIAELQQGKRADLVVLSDDPLTASDDRLRKISSLLTFQAGKIVHKK